MAVREVWAEPRVQGGNPRLQARAETRDEELPGRQAWAILSCRCPAKLNESLTLPALSRGAAQARPCLLRAVCGALRKCAAGARRAWVKRRAPCTPSPATAMAGTVGLAAGDRAPHRPLVAALL